MKIKIITPEGEKIQFEADFWEFFQNKFVDEDAVLIFYKEEVQKDIPAVAKTKLSTKGILPASPELLQELLKNVVGEERLKKEREKAGVVFIGDAVIFTSESNIQSIVTQNYSIDTPNSLDSALQEFLEKEKEFSKTHPIRVFKEPIVKFAENEFCIEEEISIGKE